MGILQQEIQTIADKLNNQDNTIKTRFTNRLKEDLLTRDENNRSHFCVYFLPFNSTAKKVFIVHHKKSGLWISPGGHIDKGEYLLHALNREIMEELGMNTFFAELPQPFLLTITPIENVIQPCKEHLDIWFLVPTDGEKFNVDPKEFHDTKWMSIDEARKIVTNKENLQALEVLSKM